MYGYSTKLEAEKHGYDRFTRVIHTADKAGLIHIHPPNSPKLRSILRLLKEGTDAERCADACAVVRAERRADEYAELGAAPAGRPIYRRCGANFSCSSSGAACSSCIQVAPLELQVSVVGGRL